VEQSEHDNMADSTGSDNNSSSKPFRFVTLYHESKCIRVKCDKNIDFAKFCEMVCHTCNVSQEPFPLLLRYEDDEQDQVTMSSADEFDAAKELADELESPLVVHVSSTTCGNTSVMMGDAKNDVNVPECESESDSDAVHVSGDTTQSYARYKLTSAGFHDMDLNDKMLIRHDGDWRAALASLRALHTPPAKSEE
jgi:PB1 domain